MFRTNQRIMDFIAREDLPETRAEPAAATAKALKSLSVLLLDCSIYQLKYSVGRDDGLYFLEHLETQVVVRPELFNLSSKLASTAQKKGEQLSTVEYVEADQKVECW